MEGFGYEPGPLDSKAHWGFVIVYSYFNSCLKDNFLLLLFIGSPY